jgi:hypothetical protein
MMHDLIVGCRRAKENKHIFGDQKQGTSGLAGGGTNYGLSDGLCGGYSDRLQAAVYSTTRINAAYVSAALAYFVFVNSLAARWRLRVMARFLFAKQLVYPCFLAYQSLHSGHPNRPTAAGTGGLTGQSTKMQPSALDFCAIAVDCEPSLASHIRLLGPGNSDHSRPKSSHARRTVRASRIWCGPFRGLYS